MANPDYWCSLNEKLKSCWIRDGSTFNGRLRDSCVESPHRNGPALGVPMHGLSLIGYLIAALNPSRIGEPFQIPYLASGSCR